MHDSRRDGFWVLNRCTRLQLRLSSRRKHQHGHLQYLLTARSQQLQKLDRLQTLHRQCQLSSIRSGTLMTRRAACSHPSRSPFGKMLAACLIYFFLWMFVQS